MFQLKYLPIDDTMINLERIQYDLKVLKCISDFQYNFKAFCREIFWKSSLLSLQCLKSDLRGKGTFKGLIGLKMYNII